MIIPKIHLYSHHYLRKHFKEKKPGSLYLVLSIEEVVHDGPRDDALPMLLQKNISRRVDNEQAVNHPIDEL